jgi:hypothetical protein
LKVYLSLQKARTVFFYTRGKGVFSTVQFAAQVSSVSSFRGTLEASKTKNGGVAIDGSPQRSMNGPVANHGTVHSVTNCQ